MKEHAGLILHACKQTIDVAQRLPIRLSVEYDGCTLYLTPKKANRLCGLDGLPADVKVNCIVRYTQQTAYARMAHWLPNSEQIHQ